LQIQVSWSLSIPATFNSELLSTWFLFLAKKSKLFEAAFLCSWILFLPASNGGSQLVCFQEEEEEEEEEEGEKRCEL
jgi:hypothetical protein